MTPQERQLINDLFDRVSTLETAPRDPGAERAIADAMARAPHAIYPLVQTVLLQDEALKRANSRIEELETGARNVDAPNGNRSFLDSLRNPVPGREQGSPGSMPSAPQDVSGREVPMTQGAATPAGMAPGGSFLGNAAATAAGVIGGSLLSSGIRSLFGHGSGSVAGDKPKQSLWDSDERPDDRESQAHTRGTDHQADADSEYSSNGPFDDDADDSDFDGGDDDDDDDDDDDFDDTDEA
jgi:uncharacterized protein